MAGYQDPRVEMTQKHMNNAQDARKKYTGKLSPEIRAGMAVLDIMHALDAYREAHADLYENEIGDDGVLGEAWSKIHRGCRALLNGELGPWDPGTIDRHLVTSWLKAGFQDKDL